MEEKSKEEAQQEPKNKTKADETDLAKEFEFSEESEEKSEEKIDLPSLDKKDKKAPVVKEAEKEKEETKEEQEAEKDEPEAPEPEKEVTEHIFALRTTANREDQVMDFVTSNATKKKLAVHSVIRPHGMRGYIFVEAGSRSDAEQAAFNVPYARGILPKSVNYSEIEHMLEQVKREINIKKNDIAEIISGPFKREKCKITRIDKVKEEVVVELLEAAVPIPITLKMDAVKVIRRDTEEDAEEGEE